MKKILLTALTAMMVLAATAQDGLFDRNVFIEEFSTERCPNCPRAAAKLNTYMHNLDAAKAKRVFAAVHHVAYYTDWLTMKGATAYEYFQGAYSFAPSFMFNRAKTDYCENVSGSMEDYISTVVEEQLALKSHYALDLDVEYKEAAKQLVATVKVRRAGDCSAISPRLTVMVLEDSIKARAQSGTEPNAEYWHMHCSRACNETWGFELPEEVWENNAFDWEETFDIKSTWVPRNLIVVAFINEYDPNDQFKSEIHNITGKPYAEFAGAQSGIADIANDVDDNAPVVWYNLQGQRLEQPQAGQIAIRRQGSQASKVIVR